MLLVRGLAAASLLLLVDSADAAFYSKKSAVIQLDSKNFKSEILDSKHVSIVEFYAPWCGHCQNLKPAYDKVASSLKGIVKVAAIDCDDEKNKRTCGEYGVQGFPTLKIFSPSNRKGKPSIEDYRGERNAKGISGAVLPRVPDHVSILSDSTLDNFLALKNETTKALLFTAKNKPSPLWRSLAIDFYGAIQFGQIHEKDKEAAAKLGVSEYPTVVLLPGGAAKGSVFAGEMNRDALYEFFAGVKQPRVDPWEDEEPSPSPPSPSSSPSSETAKPKPTEKPKPHVRGLSGVAELQAICLAKKSKTCILAVMDGPVDGVVEVYGKLSSRPPPHTFQMFKVDSNDALAKELTGQLSLGAAPQLLAVNHRGWFRRFAGDVARANEVLSWLDAIKMGEGAKEKLPEALFVPEGEEETLEALKKFAAEQAKAKAKADEVKEEAGGQAVKVEEKVEKAEGAGEKVREKAEEKAEAVKEQAGEKAEAVKEQGGEKAEAVKEQAEEKAEAVKEQAEKKAEAVKEQEEEKEDAAKEKAKGKVEEKVEGAKEKAEEKAEAVKEKVKDEL